MHGGVGCGCRWAGARARACFNEEISTIQDKNQDTQSGWATGRDGYSTPAHLILVGLLFFRRPLTNHGDF